MAHRDGLVFAGANPGVVLMRDGDITVAASLWKADWSIHGAGSVAVLAGRPWPRPIAVCSSRRLARWLVHDLTRYFPEFEPIPLQHTTVAAGEVEFQTLTQSRCDCRVTIHGGATIDIKLTSVVHTRRVLVPRWQLGERAYSMENTLSPCAEATVAIDQEPVPGVVRVDTGIHGPVSTAYIATNERWYRLAR